MLVEAKLSSAGERPPELSQHRRLVGNTAKKPARDGGVETSIGDRKRFRGAFHELDPGRALGRAPGRFAARQRVGLDRDDELDLPRIELEVASVSAAGLDHSARETGKQAPAMLTGDRVGPSPLTALEIARQPGLVASVKTEIVAAHGAESYRPELSISSIR